MAIIVDRRKDGSGKSIPNKKRFMDRYKEHIKEAVDKAASKKSIKDFGENSDITITEQDLDEPSFEYDFETGKRHKVLPGNKNYNRGDKIPKPKGSAGKKGGAGKGEQGLDEFTFTLTKKEFLDLYFDEMELPDFIKESMSEEVSYKRKRAGFTEDGVPSNINIKKTFEKAIARRISTRAQGKKPAYLLDEDLMYDNYTKKPYPELQGVMFCLMDNSGSMGEEEKTIAKKFFLLLYLFLHKEYEKVDIVFISHTDQVEELEEEAFFNTRTNGGTMVSPAFDFIENIILERYNSTKYNIYVAQASDGDNWPSDNERCFYKLRDLILPKVQYYVYMQIETALQYSWQGDGASLKLYDLFQPLADFYRKYNQVKVQTPGEVYNALRELFKKGVLNE